MPKNERLREIVEILKKEGFASVSDVSKLLYVSQPTVRRDLDILERQGVIRRNHGGAVLCENEISSPVSFRKKKRSKQKSAICRMAATFIEQGTVIFADASSTALHLCEYIKPSDDLTVVTNGLPLFHSLVGEGINAILTGGSLIENSQALAGGVAKRSISAFNADLMFFSSSALGSDGMISDYSEMETELRAAMMDRSRKKVFLCDGTKFDRSSPYCLMQISKVDYIVTDTPLAENIISQNDLILVSSDQGSYLYSKTK